MVVVVLKMKLALNGTNSLKDKRRVLKTMFASIKSKFNVSIAEVADNDLHRQAVIGASIVANDSSYGHQVLSKLVNKIEQNPEVYILDYSIESY